MVAAGSPLQPLPPVWGGWPVKRCKVSRKAYSYSEQRSTVTLWVLLCVYNHLQRVQAWIHACLYAYGNAKGIQESATEFYTLPYQYKIRCSKENRNQVRKLYTFSLPLALWFRLVLSVAAWIVPMSHELEKMGESKWPKLPMAKQFQGSAMSIWARVVQVVKQHCHMPARYPPILQVAPWLRRCLSDITIGKLLQFCLCTKDIVAEHKRASPAPTL